MKKLRQRRKGLARGLIKNPEGHSKIKWRFFPSAQPCLGYIISGVLEQQMISARGIWTSVLAAWF